MLHNNQRLPGGNPKAAAIVAAATRLASARVKRAADVDVDSAVQRRAYTGVGGLGEVTWEYFGMLLGIRGVKADTWVIRVAAKALGESRTSTETRSIVKGAALRIGQNPTLLDHALWE